MEFGEIVRARRSVRKFKDTPVEWGKIVEILTAGRLAPTCGNVHNVKYVVVQDEAQRKKIAEACEGQDWIATAPTVVVILGEPEKAERMYGTRGRFIYTTQNCAAAAMSMILAAQSEGLATCWVGAFNDNSLRSILVLPENVFVHVIIPVGYAGENPDMPPKPRIEHVSFFEKFWSRRRLATPQGQWSRNIMKWSKEAKRGIERIGEKVEAHVGEHVSRLKSKILKK